MPRKASHFVSIKDGELITFAGGVMERAGSPRFLFAEWSADRVTFKREEDYEGKQQGIYKVGWAGRVNGQGGQARITARPIVQGAGLEDGRYIPIHVDEDSIVIPTTPVLTPDQYKPRNVKAIQEDDDV